MRHYFLYINILSYAYIFYSNSNSTPQRKSSINFAFFVICFFDFVAMLYIVKGNKRPLQKIYHATISSTVKDTQPTTKDQLFSEMFID